MIAGRTSILWNRARVKPHRLTEMDSQSQYRISANLRTFCWIVKKIIRVRGMKELDKWLDWAEIFCLGTRLDCECAAGTIFISPGHASHN